MRAGLRRFFFPPAGVSIWRRLLPYGVALIVLVVLFLGVSYVWDYTNSPSFCGATCHTMPPEYAAYQVSPHARVLCVECHIGRDFIAAKITRKAGDIQHVISTLFQSYEYPIFADAMRPARETCEQCHYPEKFSDDSLRQNIRYHDDEDNTRYTIFLAMRTGGGSAREGLGRGIHWHVENPVWFVAEDHLQQTIPYVRVVGPDGAEDVYVALNASQTAEALAGMKQEEMDCITCHNRISHKILPPAQAVAQALFRRQIDASIPFIRARAVEVLSAQYATDAEAQDAIRALPAYYAKEAPAVYNEKQSALQQAVETLLKIYSETTFRSQKVDWQTHPNNVGHADWPGCFRCHDGQHVNQDGGAIRLECNLCHSIPLVVEPGVMEPKLSLVTGIQPESHFSTHWIALHRESFDQTCQACHDVRNPGGIDNTSFCSNSMCHGVTWKYADLDAPGLADILRAEMPTAEPTAEATPPGPLTFAGQVGPLFQQKCATCHGEKTATGGLVLATYEGVMQGGKSGPAIVPGDAEASRLVQVQRGEHFAKLGDAQLQQVIDWINNGAPQN